MTESRQVRRCKERLANKLGNRPKPPRVLTLSEKRILRNRFRRIYEKKLVWPKPTKDEIRRANIYRGQI